MAEYDNFIRKALADAKYKELDRTRKTVLETISHWKGLKPVSEYFVFNNGTQKLLLALKGTVPVNYKGTTYHIPIIVWLLDTHPANAPMVFVNPTADMRIKVSRHVDHNGKVYLPYLHDWKPTTSDLLTLIQVLIMTFQEQPPVYSVPQQQQNQQPFYPPPQPAFGAGTTPYPAYPSYPSQMPMPGMPMPGMPQTQPAAAVSSASTLSSFNFRPSLVSAAQEKLRRRLEVVYLSTEIINKTGEQLKDGQQKLEMLMKRLNDEKTTLENNIEACQKECTALDEKIAKSTSEENNANIDDAIQTPAPLYKQIVNVVSEEAALEDTIYYIGEAFRREKMDLDQYLRTVRQLSRRQFMLRAILKKCRQKAGFAG